VSKTIRLPNQVGEGKDREVEVLLADHARKLVLIRLRRDALLANHSARVPIAIQALAGRGTLRIGNDAHLLVPGVVVPVDAHAVHNVQAAPALAILVTFFRGTGMRNKEETSARFD
jgi:quercetin dioxygenase-like cupin family protein